LAIYLLEFQLDNMTLTNFMKKGGTRKRRKTRKNK
jgi:hypothetical protein